ncbi:MAG: hypothetical protein JRI25_13280 [Deltaproteobacteria bacterium]|nr:hypothetical protein [Deltaproteobacteria bacterium]MBW2255556.1 hypothetical protein [Deltaproteobacteria bacterium]
MLLWWASVAMAGTIYVNGVDVTGLRGQSFDNVTITFDSNGDVHISAPQYEIEVVDPQAPTIPPPTTSPDPPRTAPPLPTPPSGVAEGRWWLISEDNGSAGHTVEIFINDTPVQTVQSQGEQIIEDVGPWLRPGTNRIKMVSMSRDASGGALYVYLGTGSNDSGTLVMDTPDVQFGLGASRSGSYTRDYTIEVQ